MVRPELSLIGREMVLLAEKILEQKPGEWGRGGAGERGSGQSGGLHRPGVRAGLERPWRTRSGD